MYACKADSSGEPVSYVNVGFNLLPAGYDFLSEISPEGMVLSEDGLSLREKTSSEIFDESRAVKINDLRLACRAHIFAGFDSAALGGVVHHYPLSHTDQANLQKTEVSAMKNADTPGWTGMVQCVDGAGVIAYRPHTAAQVDQVAADIEQGKEAALTKFADLVAQVKDPATDTQAKLDAIQW